MTTAYQFGKNMLFPPFFRPLLMILFPNMVFGQQNNKHPCEDLIFWSFDPQISAAFYRDLVLAL